MTASATARAAGLVRSCAAAPLPAESADFGPTLVVAPHPDDEVLGLRRGDRAAPTGGHSGAGRHRQRRRCLASQIEGVPALVLAALRRAEAEAGLGPPGCSSASTSAFLGLPDGAMPSSDAPSCRTRADGWPARRCWRWPGVRDRPAALAARPARRSPGDLGAVDGGAGRLRSPARRLEYPIWSRVHPGPDDLPRQDEASAWRLDIGGVQAAEASGDPRSPLADHRI